MPADIIIPTCKSRVEIEPLIEEINRTDRGGPRVIATCTAGSAAQNRNIGLDQAKTDAVIMIDDDVTKFPDGWNIRLEEALRSEPDAVMVSASLLDTGGNYGQMLGDPERKDTGISEVARRELPTACIAFWNDGIRFDEAFIGSGWEDTDFMAQLRAAYPNGRWLVCNDVKVVHVNEMKNQAKNFKANMKHYCEKWGRALGNYV